MFGFVFQSLSEAEIHSYAATVRNNEELIDALYDFLEDEDPDHEVSYLPDNFGDISLTKAVCRKYLKEKCSSELYLQFSIKTFANSCIIPKLFSKG